MQTHACIQQAMPGRRCVWAGGGGGANSRMHPKGRARKAVCAGRGRGRGGANSLMHPTGRAGKAVYVCGQGKGGGAGQTHACTQQAAPERRCMWAGGKEAGRTNKQTLGIDLRTPKDPKSSSIIVL